MVTLLYRFGAFRLDPQARELLENGQRVDLPLSTIDCLIHLIRNRDRPVGRDELASVVWGRVDVSEVSLSHAIMRLRRVLGDDGNAQRYIRTVQRLGYRWVMDLDADTDAIDASRHVIVTEAVANLVAGSVPVEPPPSTLVDPQPSPPEASRAGRSSRRMPWVLLAVLVVFATFATWTGTRAPPVAENAFAPGSAMVLPVALEAGEDAAWMRLGLMDLIATQLRRGGLATMPSETVVALLGAARADARTISGQPAAWTIQAHARLEHGKWTVSLEADGQERRLHIRTHADDALVATRNAADELLIRLGFTPPLDETSDSTLAAATLRQRVNAALLSGQPAIAQRIVEQAPASLQADPEVALARSRVEFSSGAYAGAQEQAQQLARRLPIDAAPGLRARALNLFAAAAMRQGLFDLAEPAYVEATQRLTDQGEPGELATAWRGLAAIAVERGQLERATAEFGRARTLYELANDPFGSATVDLNLAIIAMQRGHPVSALASLQDVRARLQHFAAAEAFAATEIVMVEAQLALLDPAAALATSATFDSRATAAGNPRLYWQLLFARAAALHGAGRLAESDALLARLNDGSDAQADLMARALGDLLTARIALERDDLPRALEFATAAMIPGLEARNAEQFAQAALIRILALQRHGDLDAAATAIERLQAIAEPMRDDRVRLPALLAFARAEQAAAMHDRISALRHYAEAMRAASVLAIPEDMVCIGLPYVRELVAAGQLDEAASINGRIAPWSDRDMRAAWSQALLYEALGETGAAADALARARRLAGERQ